jgi:hypothetical protein
VARLEMVALDPDVMLEDLLQEAVESQQEE